MFNIRIGVVIAISVVIVFQTVGIHVKGNQVTAHYFSPVAFQTASVSRDNTKCGA
ncbi:hypothetical protein DR91_2075 [Neisseria lactamica ATCC 23970]|nr:hypothetical protein DR91_2075 [Neisseria lactamica ATCC 23970]